MERNVASRRVAMRKDPNGRQLLLQELPKNGCTKHASAVREKLAEWTFSWTSSIPVNPSGFGGGTLHRKG